MDRLLAFRRLREQQDREYELAMKLDRKKQRLKKEKEEERKRLKEEKLEKLRARANLRDMLKVKLMNEPVSDNVADCTRCVIRMPNGSKFNRIFCMDSPMEQLYIFLMVNDESLNDFRINTNCPRREIPPPKFLLTNQAEASISGSSSSSSDGDDVGDDGGMTFRQFGFSKSEALFVAILEA
ncbi:hypothetical protein HELRODRAFT_172535 [Helobdella robusta]|uniref:UBX domain-containing protein n=1 Tax=Helobdella robusta TaxID=6412 RepID=T1F5H3_HELRO|nr:hypothetical protein HELRODRAFT_172535 [Helobdella robusta]ESO04189.1 hypothetical protein HELRODRAFT_172535 [Helobdella robusta]